MSTLAAAQEGIHLNGTDVVIIVAIVAAAIVAAIWAFAWLLK